jgi:hypothetical protein
MRRTALGVFVLLAFMTGLFALAPSGAGAEGPVSRFVGFVVAQDGDLPTRVRALGADGVVCGTSELEVSNEILGFYDVSVISAAERAGCPSEGDAVALWLLYGNVDDGVPAQSSLPTLFRSGEIQVRYLSASSAPSVEGWSGTPPPAGGYALMVWGGPDGAPVDQALELLAVDVKALWFYDAGLKQFRMYVPGGPGFVQTYTVMGAGDIVVVKAR